ncbi:MAG: hypothetical protein ACKVS5_05995 [Parvularculaceae bacterium]
MTDGQLKIVEIHHQTTERFVYFLLATAAASIAFAVSQTNELPLKCSQIPLGVAVLCWGLSFGCGCLVRIETHRALHANLEKLSLIRASTENALNSNFVDGRKEKLTNEFTSRNKKITCQTHLQISFYAAGGLFFIIWHIIEMYLRIKET